MNRKPLQAGLNWGIGAMISLLLATSSWSDDGAALRGADAVLQIATAGVATSATNSTGDARRQFVTDLAQFTATSGTMAPAEAADKWLQLVDRYWTLPKGTGGPSAGMMDWRMLRYQPVETDEGTLPQVFAAVPGPASWPILETRTANRKDTDQLRMREAGLRIFTRLLNRNWSGAVAIFDGAIQSLSKDDDSSPFNWDQLLQHRHNIERLAKGEQVAGMAAEFERLLDAVTNAPSEEVQIIIPELVGMVGTNQAERLIEKAVRISNVHIEITAGTATRSLVKAAVLRNLDKIALPQWQLVKGADAVEYYEAMLKRFPPKAQSEGVVDRSFGDGSLVQMRSINHGENEYELRTARLNYILGLLAADRLDDALRLAKTKDLDYSELVGRHRDGNDLELPAIKVFRFAQQLLQQKPDARAWRVLVVAGMEAARDPEVQATISAPRAVLSDPARQVERDMAIAAGYFALDQIDDGLAILRQASTRRIPGTPEHVARNLEQTRDQAIQKIVELGCVLDRQALVDEGCSLILSTLTPTADDSNGNEYGGDFEFDEVINQLILTGRYRQAEDLAVALLRKALQRSTTGQRGYWAGSGLAASPLTMLARIYGAAGQSSDVLTLLEKAPWWGVEDLLETQPNSCGSRSSLMPVAAAALLAQGRTNDATRIARTFLMINPGDDDGYTILARAGDPGTGAWLDAMSARDRFEERPLIWKAVLQLNAGQLESAEKTVREAIKVDPTDGETRAGDRVRAYAVLADVLEARGKQADAALYRNVVASVRLAEKGDALTSAGLLRRSIVEYDKAASLFADAYCVQWRLAERLYATGHPQEAEKHYEIVFERMPEQFGQVARLCFGCEGVFDRTESRTVAERILTRMAANGTVRPQVYFLLGQLREAQGRYPEAYTAFHKAVEIDCEYLDGWRQLANIAEQVAIPQAERDAIYLRMLNLDPLCFHNDFRARITDLKGLWETIAANQQLAWDPPKTLWPLAASKAALEQKRSAAHGAGLPEPDQRYRRVQLSPHRMPRPGEAVVTSAIVAQTLEALWAGER